MSKVLVWIYDIPHGDILFNRVFHCLGPRRHPDPSLRVPIIVVSANNPLKGSEINFKCMHASFISIARGGHLEYTNVGVILKYTHII